MFTKYLLVLLLALTPALLPAAKYIGNYNTNQYDLNSVNNPYGTYGNPYNPDSIHNPYGRYGNIYSNFSVTNPYATRAPKLYDQQGNYRGRLSANVYDRDSITNPYGRYGNKYSPESLNYLYGAGAIGVISIYGE